MYSSVFLKVFFIFKYNNFIQCKIVITLNRLLKCVAELAEHLQIKKALNHQRFLLSLYFYPIYNPGNRLYEKRSGNSQPLYILYYSLSEHGFCNFYETGDICPFHIVYIAVFLFTVVSAGFVDSDHNLF